MPIEINGTHLIITESCRVHQVQARRIHVHLPKEVWNLFFMIISSNLIVKGILPTQVKDGPKDIVLFNFLMLEKCELLHD